MKRLGLYLPVRHKSDFLLTTGMAGASLLPGIGLLPLGLSRMADLGLITAPDHFIVNAACAGTALALSPFAISRGSMLFGDDDPSSPEVSIDVCGMPCRENALFTGVLILGSTGSGKTSSAILKPIDQIFHTYNHPGYDPKDPLLNIGGFCLDAKMEFFEPQLYFMHDAGRNVLKDAVILRPNCFIPVGVFEEPETGRRFYLQGQGFSTGSDVQKLIVSSKLAKERAIKADFLMARPDDRAEAEEKLKGIVFDVEKLDVSYLGFRRSGSELHPLVEISSIKDFVVDKSRSIPCPKHLVYKEMSGVDTGLRYNLVNNRVSSVVAGQRLANIAALIDGGEGAKKDPYWDKQAASLFAQVMDAWRLLDAAQANNLFSSIKDTSVNSNRRRDLGGPDILRIVEQPDVQENLIRELKARRDKLAQEALAQSGRNRVLARECKSRHRKSDDLIKYFDLTWRTLAPNTKSIIESCVRTMFGPFAQDELLAESFCSPSTISFDEMITEGKYFFFVAGNDFRDLAKAMGTAVKLDAHSTVLSRKARGDLNKNRRIMENIDECQMYAVAGEGGDQETKAMSRSSRLFHFNASQSEASIEEVVGHNRYRTYVQTYGVRVSFQSMDPESRRQAANLTGQIYREKRDVVAEDLTHEHLLGLKGGSGPKDHVRYEKELLYNEHVFLELDTQESIVFNKDRSRWRGESKVHRQVNEPHPIGGEAMAETLANFLSEYAHSYAEYCVQNKTWNPEGLDGFQRDAKLPPKPPAAGPRGNPVQPAKQPKAVTPDQQVRASVAKHGTPAAPAAKVSPPPSAKVAHPQGKKTTAAPETKAPPPPPPPPQETAQDLDLPESTTTKPTPEPETSNTNAFLVRDPGADETKGSKRRPTKPNYIPPPPGLVKVKAQPPSPAISEKPASTDPSADEPTLADATARYSAGKASAADLDVINQWCADPANQTAFLASYFSGVVVDGVNIEPTQSIAQMAEHGGNPTAIHRGPRGASQGTPKGRGSAPGNAEMGIPESSLDLSDKIKNQADALADAARTINKETKANQSPFSLEQLRQKYGNLG